VFRLVGTVAHRTDRDRSLERLGSSSLARSQQDLAARTPCRWKSR
jgi:hypothetical protein